MSSAEQMGEHRTDLGAGSQQWKPLPKKSFLLESLLEGRVLSVPFLELCSQG